MTDQARDAPIPRQALVLLVILTIVWGTNWPLFKYATAEVSVWTFRSIALLISGSVLLLVAKLQGKSLSLPRTHWAVIGIASFFYLFLWNLLSTYAAILIPSGQAAILGFTMPLWGGLISVLWFRQSLQPRLLGSLLLAAVAVGLLMSKSLGAYSQAPLGFALGLGSGLGWAIGTHILKSKPVQVPPAVLTGWQLLLCAFPIGLGALVLGDGHWFIPSWRSIAVISYIALVPMCIGNLCWFTIVGILPANTAGISSIAVPMVAMLSGALINAEPLGSTQWLAMACSAWALGLTLLKK